MARVALPGLLCFALLFCGPAAGNARPAALKGGAQSKAGPRSARPSAPAAIAEPSPADPGSTRARLDLVLQAPPQCPQAPWVLQRVHAHLRGLAPSTSAPQLSARATIARQGNGYHLALETQQAGLRGQRSLQAATCEELAETLTLVLSLMLGRSPAIAPQAEQSTPTQASVPPRPAPTKPAPKVLARPDRALVPRATTTALACLVGAEQQLRLWPAPAPAVALGVEAQLPWLRFGLEAGLLPSSRHPLDVGVSGDFMALQTAVYGCVHSEWSRLGMAACAGARGSLLRGQAQGETIQQGRAQAAHVAVLPSLDVTWPTHARIALRIRSTLGVSVNRPRFTIQNHGTVHKVPRYLPTLGVYLVFFP